MDFGLFLDKFCDQLDFEPNIDGLTPDWLVSIKGQKALIEVARLKDTQEVDEQTKRDQEAGRIRFHTYKMRPERVFGNTIMTKLNAYGELSKVKKILFVIAIYNRHLSGAHRKMLASYSMIRRLKNDLQKIRTDQMKTSKFFWTS